MMRKGSRVAGKSSRVARKSSRVAGKSSIYAQYTWKNSCNGALRSFSLPV